MTILQVQHQAIVVVVLPGNLTQDLEFTRKGLGRYGFHVSNTRYGVQRASFLEKKQTVV